MLDVKKIQTLGEIAVELKHPVTREPLGATIRLAGPEHPARRAIRFATQRRVREELQREGKVAALDPEEAADEGVKMIAASVLGWSGICEFDEPLAFSSEAALALLLQPEMAWLVEQIAAVIGNDANFIGGSGIN